MRRTNARPKISGKVYIDNTPVDQAEAEYHQPSRSTESAPSVDGLPPGVQTLLSDLKIPYGNQFGRGSDVDPTLGLLNHIIECVAGLRDTVKVYNKRECGDFSSVVGTKIVSALTGEIGKMLIYSLTNDWEGQDTAAGHFHTISSKILNSFPEIATRQHKVSGKMLIHHTCHKSSSKYTAEYIGCLLTIVPASASCQDAHGAVPLHWAMRNIHASVDMIKSLVQAFPNGPKIKDKKGFLPLHWAVHQEHPRAEIVDALLRMYPGGAREPCESGGLPLHWAVNQDVISMQVIQLLITAYPEALNTPCNAGWLPIHRAVDRSNPDFAAVRYLVEQFPRSLQRPCNDGQLPLHKILDHFPISLEVFNYVLDGYPAACQVSDKDGYLPLHTALDCPEPNAEIVSRLMQSFPAAVRRATLDDFVPLHLAVTTPINPPIEVIRMLVHAHPLAAQQVAIDHVPENEMANPDTWNGKWIEKKWTPLARAIDRKLHDIVSILKSAITNKQGSSVQGKTFSGSKSRRRSAETSSRDSRSSMESHNYDYESESGASGDHHSEGPPVISTRQRAQDFEMSDDSELESKGSRGSSSRNTSKTGGRSRSSHGQRSSNGGYRNNTGGKFRINVPKDAVKIRTSPLYGDRASKADSGPGGWDVDLDSTPIKEDDMDERLVGRETISYRNTALPAPATDSPYVAAQAAVSGLMSQQTNRVSTAPIHSRNADIDSPALNRVLSYDSKEDDIGSQTTQIRTIAPKLLVHNKFSVKSHQHSLNKSSYHADDKIEDLEISINNLDLSSDSVNFPVKQPASSVEELV